MTTPQAVLESMAKAYLHSEADTPQDCMQAATHVPSGLVRAETHRAVNLQGANAFLAGQHHMHDAEPAMKRLGSRW